MAVCGATRHAVPEYGITLDLIRQSATTTVGPTQAGRFTLRLLSRLLASDGFGGPFGPYGKIVKGRY